MSDRPLVSVLLTTYNRKEYLPYCIESVLNQTYSDLEFIIVDDGSTDGTAEQIRNYHDPRIKLYILNQNRNISYATNYGLEKVTGDYLAYIDSDDLWHPQKLEKQITFLKDNPQFMACFTWVDFIDENGNCINDSVDWMCNLFRCSTDTREEWLRFFFFKGNRLAKPSALVQMSAARAVGRHTMAFVQAHDFDWWVRFTKRYSFAVMEEPLVQIRRFSASSLNTSGVGEEQNNRFLNEHMIIRAHFFDDMDADDLVHVFGQNFINPHAESYEELECEKAFLLLRCDDLKATYPIWGLYKLAELLQEPEMAKLLENEYNFTAQDYYKLNLSTLYTNQDVKKEYFQTLDILHNTEKKYLETIDKLNRAVQVKIEAEELLHDTEKKFLNAIGEKEQAEQETVKQLKTLQRLEQENIRLHQHNSELQDALNAFQKSTSWKMTAPFRVLKKTIFHLKEYGLSTTLKKIIKKIKGSLSEQEIQKTNIFCHEVSVSKRELLKQKARKFPRTPLISIITPLYNTPAQFLKELLDSVEMQTYENWELCAVNFSDAAFDSVDQLCKQYAEKDVRIKYYTEKKNYGISENTNTCILHSTGDFIALLDHDDVLHPSALYEVVSALNRTGGDFFYTDEIKFEKDLNNLFLPNFKPDFSADELRAHNYICHFNVFSRKLFDMTGGYRKEFDGSQDHDMVLRLTEKAKKIVHIPQILYYWRVHSNSVAQSIEAKSYATDAGANAVTEQLRRLGDDKQYAESVQNHIPIYRIFSKENIREELTVAIWDVKNLDGAVKTRDSIVESQAGKYHFVAVESKDGCSEGAEIFEKNQIYFMERNGKSEKELWDQVMERSSNEFVFWIRGGSRIVTKNFFNEFMLYAKRKDIAAIDSKILSEDMTVFSGGLTISENKIRLRCQGAADNYAGYENGMLHNRNVYAGSGLGTMVFKSIWEKQKGFRFETPIPILSYTCFCTESGYCNLWTPFVKIQGDFMILQEIYQSERVKKKSDPYLHEAVYRLHLE